MPTHLFASAGPATGLFEALATAIGSGFVIGGFAAGTMSFALSRSVSQLERSAVIGSYCGGSVGLLALTFDILRERFV